MKRITVLIAWGLSGFASARDIQITTHVIEVSQERLTGLMADAGAGGDLFRLARGAIVEGQGKAVDTAVVRTEALSDSMIGSIEERIFPDYDVPYYCSIVQEGVPPVSPPPRPSPVVPCNFTVRELGVRSQWSAVASGDSDHIAVRGTWQSGSHLSDTVFADHSIPGRLKCPQSQPNLTELKFSTSVTVSPGRWRLVSVQSGCDSAGKIDSGRKLLFFLKADWLDG